MIENIIDRLSSLRETMKEKGLAAFLVNGSDPHMSEYVHQRWATREYISGFSGSYGWLAITLNEAVLWTDSRYYLQAGKQLEGTGIEMLKARLPETIPTEKWVSARLKSGDKVAFDGSCYSIAEVLEFQKEFSAKGILLEVETDLLDMVWADRPEKPMGKVYEHPLEYAGISRTDKFDRITAELKAAGVQMQIISALDDLAWTFNIRGADVEYNPVVLGYGIVGEDGAKLFVDTVKIYEDLLENLKSDGVEVLPYESFFPFLSKLNKKKIWIDPQRTNYLVYQSLVEKNSIYTDLSIPCKLKAQKNSAEVEGFRKAVLADGLALLDFQLWLESTIGKQRVTEYDIALKLTEFRAKQHSYKGDSFFPIVGYKAHGAIVHYHVSESDALDLDADGMVLFDSGGQYEFGTTDITRTIGLGNITAQMKSDFTLVLKGMIALTQAKFITGTIGCHLDILARTALWQHGLNYGHGTGHGIGAHLNVHEGPMGIRLDLNNQPILPGMVLSNEPAFYREGQYGLRTENMMVCMEDEKTEFGNFSRFDTLTLYPIDVNLIEKSLLNATEVDWINQYHQTVWAKLSDLCREEQKILLERLVKPI